MSTSDNITGLSISSIPNHLIRNVTLRQLQVFEAIYRLGSFTRAAEEMFLTQPTVSTQVRKLSEAVGVPLLEQVGRNVKPTQAGDEVYLACKSIFETLFNLDTNISNIRGLTRGCLSLCVVTTAKYVAPEILGEFSRQFPGIELSLTVSNRDTVIDRMMANQDDLYIMGQAPTDRIDVDTYRFSPNPLVVLAPKDHHLVGKKPIPLVDLLAEPFIIREPGSGIRDVTFKTFDAIGARPNVRMELNSSEAIKHAINGGLGLSILSLHTLALEGTKGPLTILDVEGFPILRNWYIVHPSGKNLSLIAQAFLDFTVEYEPKFRQQMIATWPSLEEAIMSED